MISVIPVDILVKVLPMLDTSGYSGYYRIKEATSRYPEIQGIANDFMRYVPTTTFALVLRCKGLYKFIQSAKMNVELLILCTALLIISLPPEHKKDIDLKESFVFETFDLINKKYEELICDKPQ